MELYVVRHGQTEWNVLEKVCGRTDLPLNETGEAQARALAEQMKADGLRVDQVLLSPMLRTRQTAEILNEALQAPMAIDQRLIEVNYGIYEGINRWHQGFVANRKCFAFRYPQGESMLDVGQRVYNLLDELKTHTEWGSVLLVCHGGVCRLLNSYFEDQTNAAFERWQVDNATLLHYQL